MFGATGSKKVLGELPGDSWAAYGIPKLGPTVQQLRSALVLTAQMLTYRPT